MNFNFTPIKILMIVAALAIFSLLFSVGTANSAEIDLVPMGLQSMEPMSDAEGMEVRGMGYWGYYGSATASVSGFVVVQAPGIYIFERKAASDYGRGAAAVGGFEVNIRTNTGFVSVYEVGFARAGSAAW